MIARPAPVSHCHCVSAADHVSGTLAGSIHALCATDLYAPCAYRTSAQQPDQAADARDGAIDRERCQCPGFEVASQETHREVGGDEGCDAAREHLAMDVLTERTEQVRDLQHACRKD